MACPSEFRVVQVLGRRKVIRLLIALFPCLLFSTGWPVADIDAARPVGNSWGAIQTFYPDAPYLHPGIDVMGVTVGQPVFAVAPGVVKAWVTISAEFHWRLAIADTETSDSCDGWLYAHIDPTRDHVEVGEIVETGDLIGFVVPWPGGFDHCHWARIRSAGATWYPDWLFIDNPWPELLPKGDTLPPSFTNALENQLFAFRENNSNNYLSSANLQGDVDIIARIHDKTGEYWEDVPDTGWENLAPYEVFYEIHGERSLGPIRSFVLDGYLQDISQHVDLFYSYDNVCHSDFSDGYTNRKYFYILTNTDGDSLREPEDYDSCWHTAEFPDGDYWVVVTAKDAAGNSSIDSMQVFLNNGNSYVVENTDDAFPFEILTPTVIVGRELSVVSRSGNICRIFDVSGRQVEYVMLESSPKPQKISLSRLPAGIYFLKSDVAKTHSFKFIITR